jgi:hypothetical protein
LVVQLGFDKVIFLCYIDVNRVLSMPQKVKQQLTVCTSQGNGYALGGAIKALHIHFFLVMNLFTDEEFEGDKL